MRTKKVQGAPKNNRAGGASFGMALDTAEVATGFAVARKLAQPERVAGSANTVPCVAEVPTKSSVSTRGTSSARLAFSPPRAVGLPFESVVIEPVAFELIMKSRKNTSAYLTIRSSSPQRRVPKAHRVWLEVGYHVAHSVEEGVHNTALLVNDTYNIAVIVCPRSGWFAGKSPNAPKYRVLGPVSIMDTVECA